MQCTSNFPTIDDQLFRRVELFNLFGLFEWCLIYSSTQEEQIKCLQAVLKCFWLHGLKLKPLKCEFFKEKIEYLGHSVSSKGVWPSRDNMKANTKCPKPTMYTAIKGFVRLIGHYRCFIKDFARIADPLHEYARGDTAKKKEWLVLSKAARNAFHQLKKAVMSAPVLGYPGLYKEYLLKTNASNLGLGAVLSQKQSMGGTILLPSGVGHYMVRKSITTIWNLSFWPWIGLLNISRPTCLVAASRSALIITLSHISSPHPTWMPQSKDG